MTTVMIEDWNGEMKEVKVGDTAGFKYDIEQYGEIIAIRGNDLTVMATEGGYVASALGLDNEQMEHYDGEGVPVQVYANRCWL